jgi:hypothetical protein
LRFDDKEVDKLREIAGERIKGGLGYGKIFLGAELRSKTMRKNGLSSNFSQNGDAQSHPCELERISEDIEITCGKDEGDNRCICDTRGPGIVPRQQAGEEGVVMCELLSGGSRCLWGLAGCSEVREFGLSLLGLNLGLFDDRSWKCMISIVYKFPTRSDTNRWPRSE